MEDHQRHAHTLALAAVMAKYPKQMIWTIVVDIQTIKYLIFYIKIIIGVKITLTH